MGSRCAPSRDVASCIHSQQQLSTTAQSARYYQPQPRSGDGQSPWLATVTCTLHVMSAPHSTEPMVKHCTSSPRLNQQAVPYGRALSYTNHGGTSVPFNIREQLQQECHALVRIHGHHWLGRLRSFAPCRHVCQRAGTSAVLMKSMRGDNGRASARRRSARQCTRDRYFDSQLRMHMPSAVRVAHSQCMMLSHVSHITRSCSPMCTPRMSCCCPHNPTVPHRPVDVHFLCAACMRARSTIATRSSQSNCQTRQCMRMRE